MSDLMVKIKSRVQNWPARVHCTVMPNITQGVSPTFMYRKKHFFSIVIDVIVYFDAA